jgi:hypothetical protein
MRIRILRYDEPARLRAGFSLALSLACAVAPAFAQVTATSEYLARMDLDADGRVALVEYQDWLSYAFDAMDADHDGLLSPAEQPGGRGKPLTREAHRARLAEMFRRQDANRDGVLSAMELAAPPR